MITVAQAMVKCLEEERTSVVFGYPGAAIGAFYDALSYSKIKHILVDMYDISWKLSVDQELK